MDNTIYFHPNAPSSQLSSHRAAAAAQKKEPAVFAKLVAKSTINDAKKPAVNQQNPKNGEQHPVFLGQISKNSPTVSHLMLKNKQIGNKSWDIIHCQINRDKPYTKVSAGTKIFLNPENNELFLGSKEVSSLAGRGKISPPASETAAELSLGTLDSDTPTVSHLLALSEEFADEKWQILSLPVNANKNFRHIPTGSPIHINRQTKEISWDVAQPSSASTQALFAKEEVPALSPTKADNLSTAVRQFIGTPYSKIDCYGLVVKGLQNIGIQYQGKTGLYRHLTNMAKTRGLPANAYLTGEGLVAAAGSKILYETFPVVKKPDLTAQQTLEKMSDLLERGQILSFSTPTRGHTGIISRQPDGQWTFINSGRMDHPVTPAQTDKEVGEEALLAELTNWFRLAKRRQESLTVTLGSIDPDKIRSLQDTTSGTLLATI